METTMSIEMTVYDFVTNQEVPVAVRYSTGAGKHAVQMCVPFKRWLELCEFFSHTFENDGYVFEGRRPIAKNHLGYWLKDAEYVNWTFVEKVPESHRAP
jgi:hypothetical protein